jgi:hypothetical protein
MWLGVAPDSYRKAAGLVSAYVHGDEDVFEELYEDVPEDVTKALIEGTYALLGQLAEWQDSSLSDMLESYCLSANHVAELIEESPPHLRRVNGTRPPKPTPKVLIRKDGAYSERMISEAAAQVRAELMEILGRSSLRRRGEEDSDEKNSR